MPKRCRRSAVTCGWRSRSSWPSPRSRTWCSTQSVNRLLDLIRVALFAPILAIGLAVVYSRLYHRLYPLVSQIGAPAFGIGVTVLAVIAASHGVSLIATVVLVSIYIFFMLGMTFYSALGSSLLVFASYFVAAAAVDLPLSVQVIDGGVLIFTNVIGAMVCYTLERATRTNYLEERLLIETASRDGLTGIHNRRLFDEHVDRMWPQATRDHASLGLLLIDIDHFKAYNDFYGHQAGDECLRQVAWCLSRCARRPLDITARYGGEEFAVVLYEADRGHVEAATRRIQMEIESLAIVHAASPAASKRLTVSIGAACIVPKPGRTQYGFIQLADEALYDAKERGRNCVVIMDKEYEQLHTGEFRKGASLPPRECAGPASAERRRRTDGASVRPSIQLIRNRFRQWFPRSDSGLRRVMLRPCPSASAVCWSPTAARSPSA